MSSGPPRVVLDANVLAPPSLCNLLLRAAALDLFTPRWSSRLLDEVQRTQLTKLPRPYSAEEAAFWRERAEACFPEAMVEIDDSLIARLTNDPKDRHVLAAAVLSEAPTIVTANLRDFHRRDLGGLGIEALHPDDFMLRLYDKNPRVVARAVRQMARRETVAQTLARLAKHTPRLSRTLSSQLPR